MLDPDATCVHADWQSRLSSPRSQRRTSYRNMGDGVERHRCSLILNMNADLVVSEQHTKDYWFVVRESV